MLQLKNVTIKHNKQLLLHNCNSEIAAQSIIMLKNQYSSEIIAKTLAGFQSVQEGEIHLIKEFINTDDKNFFLITENYNKLWRNYRIHELSKILKTNIYKSRLLKKYNISTQDSVNSLTNFQKLIYIIAIGKSLNRNIFIMDKPTKNFDYEDMDNFFAFLKNDFNDENYIILSNQFDENFFDLSISVYQLGSNKSLLLRGGENNDN